MVIAFSRLELPGQVASHQQNQAVCMVWYIHIHHRTSVHRTNGSARAKIGKKKVATFSWTVKVTDTVVLFRRDHHCKATGNGKPLKALYLEMHNARSGQIYIYKPSNSLSDRAHANKSLAIQPADFAMPGRRCHAPPRWGKLWCSLVVCALMLSSTTAQTNMYGQCYGHLLTADANQNSFLSNTEFADAVRRVSYNAVNVQYIDLPPSLIAAFTTNSQGASGIPIPGTSLGIAPTSALDDLCEDIYTGILTALSVTVSFQKCFH